MDDGSALRISGVVIASVVALNCVYGIYLSLASPSRTPSTRAQRLFITLLGLQAMAMQALVEYTNRGRRETETALLAGSLGAIALTILFAEIALRWLGLEAGLLAMGLFCVVTASFLPAILLRERVFPSGR